MHDALKLRGLAQFTDRVELSGELRGEEAGGGGAAGGSSNHFGEVEGSASTVGSETGIVKEDRSRRRSRLPTSLADRMKMPACPPKDDAFRLPLLDRLLSSPNDSSSSSRRSYKAPSLERYATRTALPIPPSRVPYTYRFPIMSHVLGSIFIGVNGGTLRWVERTASLVQLFVELHADEEKTAMVIMVGSEEAIRRAVKLLEEQAYVKQWHRLGRQERDELRRGKEWISFVSSRLEQVDAGLSLRDHTSQPRLDHLSPPRHPLPDDLPRLPPPYHDPSPPLPPPPPNDDSFPHSERDDSRSAYSTAARKNYIHSLPDWRDSQLERFKRERSVSPRPRRKSSERSRRRGDSSEGHDRRSGVWESKVVARRAEGRKRRRTEVDEEVEEEEKATAFQPVELSIPAAAAALFLPESAALKWIEPANNCSLSLSAAASDPSLSVLRIRVADKKGPPGDVKQILKDVERTVRMSVKDWSLPSRPDKDVSERGKGKKRREDRDQERRRETSPSPLPTSRLPFPSRLPSPPRPAFRDQLPLYSPPSPRPLSLASPPRAYPPSYHPHEWLRDERDDHGHRRESRRSGSATAGMYDSAELARRLLAARTASKGPLDEERDRQGGNDDLASTARGEATTGMVGGARNERGRHDSGAAVGPGTAEGRPASPSSPSSSTGRTEGAFAFTESATSKASPETAVSSSSRLSSTTSASTSSALFRYQIPLPFSAAGCLFFGATASLLPSIKNSSGLVDMYTLRGPDAPRTAKVVLLGNETSIRRALGIIDQVVYHERWNSFPWPDKQALGNRKWLLFDTARLEKTEEKKPPVGPACQPVRTSRNRQANPPATQLIQRDASTFALPPPTRALSVSPPRPFSSLPAHRRPYQNDAPAALGGRGVSLVSGASIRDKRDWTAVGEWPPLRAREGDESGTNGGERWSSGWSGSGWSGQRRERRWAATRAEVEELSQTSGAAQNRAERRPPSSPARHDSPPAAKARSSRRSKERNDERASEEKAKKLVCRFSIPPTAASLFLSGAVVLCVLEAQNRCSLALSTSSSSRDVQLSISMADADQKAKGVEEVVASVQTMVRTVEPGWVVPKDGSASKGTKRRRESEQDDWSRRRRRRNRSPSPPSHKNDSTLALPPASTLPPSRLPTAVLASNQLTHTAVAGSAAANGVEDDRWTSSLVSGRGRGPGRRERERDAQIDDEELERRLKREEEKERRRERDCRRERHRAREAERERGGLRG
ncbi:hypothetical protein JCM6882_008674 [Rhodosporidiobolus microsporus]